MDIGKMYKVDRKTIFLCTLAGVIIYKYVVDPYFEKCNENFYGANNDDNNDGNNGIDLKKVKTMTFFRDKLTTSNRSYPTPQLKCVGGNACNISLQSAQCSNTGTNENGDTQWACSSSVPDGVTMGTTNVNCEGLSDKNDKIKLDGSCGLEYTLHDNGLSDNNNKNTVLTIMCIMFLICLLLLIIMPIGRYGGPTYGYNYGYRYGTEYYGYPYMSYNTSYTPSKSYTGSPGLSTGFGTTVTR
jgi:hypothetical protein